MPSFLQLLGPEFRAKLQQDSLDFRQRSYTLVSRTRNGWFHHLLAFHAEVVGEKELLEKAGDNLCNLCEAYFYIGLRHLSEGKRGEAKECFRRAVDTGIFFFDEYLWGRSFLVHIDDPNWLPWLTMKKKR